MGLFQPSNRPAFGHQAHAAGERCPMCEQPIAQDIARKIEESMQYPGQIKVQVIRETRAVDFAK